MYLLPAGLSGDEKMSIINSAKQRAKSLGKYHSYMYEYSDHELSCIQYWLIVLYDSIENKDYLTGFEVLYRSSEQIHCFCDNHRINGDLAAEYWLELFLWHVDAIVNISMLSLFKR